MLVADIYKKSGSLPDAYGVYLLKDGNGRIVYVGKSNSIKKRVASHLRSKLSEKIRDIDYVLTNGELSALILEAKLIKKYKPKYNVSMRDDKQYPYLKLDPKEDYPRLALVRKTEKDGAKYFGPFLGGTARQIMGLVSKIFSLRACSSKVFKKRRQPCLNYYMKRCSSPCSGKISRAKYREKTRSVIEFFDKGVEPFLDNLKEKMNKASMDENFELAAGIRDKIYRIERSFVGRSLPAASSKNDMKALEDLKNRLGLSDLPLRIEAFDISNTGHSETVGAMAVFYKGRPYKEHYRRFKIRTKDLPNDTAAIYETVFRRYGRSLSKKLPLPDLIVIDGGKGQLGAAVSAIKDVNAAAVPVISLAKKNEEIYTDKERLPIILPMDSAALLLLRSLRDEVHRFAVTFHRLRRKRSGFEASN